MVWIFLDGDLDGIDHQNQLVTTCKLVLMSCFLMPNFTSKQRSLPAVSMPLTSRMMSSSLTPPWDIQRFTWVGHLRWWDVTKIVQGTLLCSRVGLQHLNTGAGCGIPTNAESQLLHFPAEVTGEDLTLINEHITSMDIIQEPLRMDITKNTPKHLALQQQLGFLAAVAFRI